mmetsp:Transcript_17033/g.37697  ORF Transcript_17033/g.37697 Transcript_17033/m.37697 type:complete len:753 (-) Transcript_17033:257-2515(-)
MTDRVARHGTGIGVTSSTGSSSEMTPPTPTAMRQQQLPMQPMQPPVPGLLRGSGMSSSAGDNPTAEFTTDDEQRELATISPTELADAETDLRGIVTQLGGMTMEGAGEATQKRQLDGLSRAESEAHAMHLPQALLRLDEEIASLPPDFKHAYLTATRRCPPTVAAEAATPEGSGWDCYRSAFLEREGYDASAAARKLCNYWKVRQSVFGPEAYCPYYPDNPNTNNRSGDLTLKKCFTASELEMWPLHNFIHLLERERDGAGRAVLFMDPSRGDWCNKFSTETMMKALFYLFQRIANEPAVRRRGWVLVINMTSFHPQNDRYNMKTILPFVYDNLPMRCRAIHLINPSTVLYYVILPVVKYFLGREMRLRLKVHYGSPSEVARSLEEYSLPSIALPQEVGGSVHIDRDAWLEARLMEEDQLLRPAIEQQRQPQLLQQQPTVDIGTLTKSRLPHQEQLPSGGYDITTFDPATMMETPGEDGSLSSFFAEMEQLPGKEPPIKRTRSNGSFVVEHHTSVQEQIANCSTSAADIATYFPAEANSLLSPADASVSTAAALYDPTLALPRIQAPQMERIAKESGLITSAAKKKAREASDKNGTDRASGKGKRRMAGSKVRKGGRQSDPRMLNAIAAKRNNGKLSLREALEAGGFVFPPKTTGRRAASTVFDSDGVSLAQRKNQLNRRLRELREKEEQEGSEEEAKDAEPAFVAAAATGDMGSLLPDSKPASVSTNDNQSYSDDDSFLEVINNLPGITDV